MRLVIIVTAGREAEAPHYASAITQPTAGTIDLVQVDIYAAGQSIPPSRPKDAVYEASEPLITVRRRSDVVEAVKYAVEQLGYNLCRDTENNTRPADG